MLKIERKNNTFRIRVNNPNPVVEFPFDGKETNEMPEDLIIKEDKFADKKSNYEGIIISRKLYLDDHIYGLGEKAFELDRKRTKSQTWNTDVGAVTKYDWYIDPMYISIPFFIVLNKKKGITGYFINSASKVIFDFGVQEYDKITIFVPEKSVEFYVFKGNNVEEVIEAYTELTGKPFLIPEWALGYQISRYSYFPQDYVIEIVKNHLNNGFKVSAVYLDIDYMDKYKIFTWDKERFTNPKMLSEELHKLGVKLITIVNPCLKVDYKYEPFKEAVNSGILVEEEDGSIFIARMWPGNCAWVDFSNKKAREWWENKIREWVEEYGIDGIWLDMNEPTTFGNEYSPYMPDNAVFHSDKGNVYHLSFRNAYPYYQAMATFNGLKQAGIDRPFILSRSGFAGIQKYAAVWTGDNIPRWEDLKLQISLALSLSISGIPYVGCDIGAFVGRANPVDFDLLVKYYEIALFFPIFRAHKSKDGIDQEPYTIPEYYSSKIRQIIDLRYKFLPYLAALALESSEKGHPILRPLFYSYQDDENVYRIDDEMLVGEFLLYSPILSRDTSRLVYLPKGKWISFWSNKEYDGGWIRSEESLPIYIRYNSIIPLASDEGIDLVVYGKEASIKLYDSTVISMFDGKISFSKPIMVNTVYIKGEQKFSIAEVDGKVINVKDGIIKIKDNVRQIILK